MTGRLLESVSYEKPCDARRSLNILVDGVADGAGEAARRRPKRSFNRLFHDFGFNSVDMARTRILGKKKKRCYCNSETM